MIKIFTLLIILSNISYAEEIVPKEGLMIGGVHFSQMDIKILLIDVKENKEKKETKNVRNK